MIIAVHRSPMIQQIHDQVLNEKSVVVVICYLNCRIVCVCAFCGLEIDPYLMEGVNLEAGIMVKSF